MNERDLLKGLAIGVLYGGPSAERPVSIESGENVARALEQAGHVVQRVLLDGSFTAREPAGDRGGCACRGFLASHDRRGRR